MGSKSELGGNGGRHDDGLPVMLLLAWDIHLVPFKKINELHGEEDYDDRLNHTKNYGIFQMKGPVSGDLFR